MFEYFKLVSLNKEKVSCAFCFFPFIWEKAYKVIKVNFTYTM